MTTHDSLATRRELRRQRRLRSDRTLFMMLVGAAVFLFATVELGRAMFFMQGVGAFVATLDEKSPAEVKRELRRYASSLADWNPLVRKAAVAALKAGTRWNLGGDPAEWSRWWYEHEATWEYKPAKKPAPATP